MSAGTRAIEHSGLGFYGFTATPSATKALYQAALRWFEELDCEPDIMGTTYNKGKLIQFGRAAAKLQAQGFAELRNFQIDSLPAGARHELEGMNLHVAWTLNFQMLAISARTSVAALSNESLLPIAMDVLQILRPEYGFGFRRDENLTPGLFVFGLSSNEPNTPEGNKEGLSIAGWGSPGIRSQCWRQGFLRDVFPWNFLTPPQLATRVGRETLRDWIETGTDQGTLRPLANDTFLWEVPVTRIPTLRSALKEARVIFDAAAYDKIYYETRDGHLLPKEEILRRMKDPTYSREVVPPPPLSRDEVFRQVFGTEAPKDLRVMHVDKTGPQPVVRELSTEEVRQIQKGKKKKT